MRKKQEIILELDSHRGKTPDWDTTASLHERTQIEVLIDIRDILEILMEQNQDHWDQVMPQKEVTVHDKD